MYPGVRMGARRSLVTVVSDNTGRIAMRQFRFTTAQQRALQRGRPIQCFGEVRGGPSSLEMVHPEYRLLRDDDPVSPENNLTAIYPTTDGIGQRKWRDLARQALDSIGRDVEELLLPETGIPGGHISREVE